MCVPVIVSEVSMVCDAGSVSHPTRLTKDGSSRDGKIPPPKEGVRVIALRPTTPAGSRCIWNDLPHIVQFVAIFLMLVLLYGVKRVFDKADKAMSTRLSCATAAFLHERRHHHAPLPRVLLATSDKVASDAVRLRTGKEVTFEVFWKESETTFFERLKLRESGQS
ncbi:unnamed protein product [Ectocarpus sp. CCAP 1310/34]|nr:unnamed protein product [Ectocarpus sp. CCAP 1310/34]